MVRVRERRKGSAGVAEQAEQTESVPEHGAPTALPEYTDRLVTLEKAGLKRLLPTQAPYRWNLHRLKLGRVLDVGCGIGRNLSACDPGSVGVDHSASSVAAAKSRGLIAYTPDEFSATPDSEPGSFDTMLCAHVLEHLSVEEADDLLATYLPSVRSGGQLVLITPQEAGFRTDSTHVRFVDLDALNECAVSRGLTVQRSYSFPFPRAVGKTFPYNEFVMVASVP